MTLFASSEVIIIESRLLPCYTKLLPMIFVPFLPTIFTLLCNPYRAVLFFFTPRFLFLSPLFQYFLYLRELPKLFSPQSSALPLLLLPSAFLNQVPTFLSSTPFPTPVLISSRYLPYPGAVLLYLHMFYTVTVHFSSPITRRKVSTSWVCACKFYSSC